MVMALPNPKMAVSIRASGLIINNRAKGRKAGLVALVIKVPMRMANGKALGSFIGRMGASMKAIGKKIRFKDKER
jgi:hypothetical protein